MKFARSMRRRLADLIVPSPNPASRKDGKTPRRMLLESLEGRQMMAGDVEFLATDPSDIVPTTTAAAESSTGGRVAQGEPGVDLVEFARNLDAAGVTYYGAAWCPACTQQRQLFEDGGQFLPFVEVTRPDRTQDPQFASLGITEYPTWIFPDDTRLTGVQSLETLSQRSGVPIPTNADERPFFAPIGSQTVRLGSPLHVPVDGYDAEGGPLTVSVSVANPDLLDAVVLTGNRSLRMSVAGFGDMVFELFDDKAPTAAGRVATLAQNGFYNNIIFHRVVNGFVIQGGDPTGTGTSGSSLGNFDDDFNVDLRHSSSGVLSFAKAGDDTNNSQFFITETATPSLDFNHSVFGQLVEGESVREAISNMQVSSERPTTDIVIQNASVFNDTENSVVMLRAKASSGSTTVTFRITDSEGNSYEEIVPVTLGASVSNAQPFLNRITPPAPVAPGTPATLQLTSTDVEQDPVTYFVSGTPTGATASVNPTTGLLTVTPNAGFTGTVNVTVGVRAATSPGSNADTQLVPFTFQSNATVAAPTSIDLQPGSDLGSSNSDNRTSAAGLTFDIAGVTPGASVQIVNTANNSVVGNGSATGTTISITTNNIAATGDGTYQLAARQVVDGVTSALSPSLSVIIDRTAATLNRTGLPTFANVNTPFTANLLSSEAATFRLLTPPAGASIAPTTGVLTWTPSSAQLGANTFNIELTDVAGNVRTETFTVTVAEEPLAGIGLRVTDLDGNPISSIGVGQEFLLQMYGLDERPIASVSGVYAAYADILFDSSLVRAVPGTTIQYGFGFGTVRKGTLSTGLFNEIGAVNSFTRPTEEQESLIATVRMESLAAGSLTFISEPADDADSEVLLFFNDDQVPAEAVNYGTATLSIGQNFTAQPDTFPITATGPTPLNVLANDNFNSGSTGTLTVTSVTQPATGGTVTLTGGQVSFTPAANFNGTTTFNYTVSNGTGGTQTVPVTLNVNITNTDNRPTAVNDSFPATNGTPINEDVTTPVTLDVLANDTRDSDNQAFTIVDVGARSGGGNVTIGSGGANLLYTPAANFNGVETFTYTIRDSGGGESTATVNVTVTAVNDAPPVRNITVNLVKDVANQLVISRSQLPTNPDTGETLRFVSPTVTSGGGTVSLAADGAEIRYTPAADFTGPVTITYRVSDGSTTQSELGTATIDVTEFTLRTVTLAYSAVDASLLDSLQGLRLTGTDATGQAVDIDLSSSTRVTRSASGIAVEDLLPGNYQFEIPAVPFFDESESARSLAANSAPEAGDSTVMLRLGRLKAEYINVQDWFSTAPQRTLTAVVQPGGPAILAQPSTATTSAFRDLAVSMNSGGTAVTVTGTRLASGTGTTAVTEAAVSGTANLVDTNAVQTRGLSGTNMRLVAINLDSGGLALNPTTTATGTGTTTPAGEPITASSSRVAAGEPMVSQATPSAVSTQGERAVSAEAVDAAMPDVSSSMRLISVPGDELAESSVDGLETFTEAVDRALTDA